MRMDGDPVAARADADGSRQSWQGTPDGLDPSLQAGTALCPETEREASVEPLDESDITELITANREGNTAVSLAAAPGLSLTSVKRLLRIRVSAGRHLPKELRRQRRPRRIHSPSIQASPPSQRYVRTSSLCGASGMRIVALFHSGKGKDSHTRKTWMPRS